MVYFLATRHPDTETKKIGMNSLMTNAHTSVLQPVAPHKIVKPKSLTAPIDFLEIATALISDGKERLANQLLDYFVPKDGFSALFKDLLKNHRFANNLYLESEEGDKKQINVFDVILRAVPTVKITTGIALQTLVDHYTAKSHSAITLVNIGIGKGHFEVQLLEEISRQAVVPQKINIIGIDIDQESINDAEKNIRSIAKGLLNSCEIHFYGICEFAESLSQETRELIALHQEECLTVVSAFSMHHIQSDKDRTGALEEIKSWKPELTILIEPDVDHFTADYMRRSANCRRHFGKVFDVIDRILTCDHEKHAIKNMFFAREIQNILQVDESTRYEKHETSAQWVSRLHCAGFNMKPVAPAPGLEQEHISFDYTKTGVIQTLCDDVPMVSVLIAL